VGWVESVNVGAARPIRAKSGTTGIDKVPVTGRVQVSAPGPKGSGGSGLEGDAICDVVHHGGDDQAIYAFAREDLDWWEEQLASTLRSGVFGENLTTNGMDVTEARLGDTWSVGSDVVLQVTGPRIPCSTFAVWMGRKGWLRSFTRRARPGAYLRVLSAGSVEAGAPVTITSRPDHDVTIGITFRALTAEPNLLPVLLGAADYLDAELIEWVETKTSH